MKNSGRKAGNLIGEPYDESVAKNCFLCDLFVFSEEEIRFYGSKKEKEGEQG